MPRVYAKIVMPAVLLTGMLTALPCSASARSAVPAPSKQQAASEQALAGGDAAMTARSPVAVAFAETSEQTAPPSRKGESRLAAERDDAEDEDEPGTRKPAPKGARSPAQTAQPSRKLETGPSADRDVDEDEDDAATKTPAAAPRGGRSPAQTDRPARKVETRPAPDGDEDDDEGHAVTKAPTAAPRGARSSAPTARPSGKVEPGPAADRSDDDEDKAPANKPAAAPKQPTSPARTTQPSRKVPTRPATERDDDAEEAVTDEPATRTRPPASSTPPNRKVERKPAADRDDVDGPENAPPAAPVDTYSVDTYVPDAVVRSLNGLPRGQISPDMTWQYRDCDQKSQGIHDQRFEDCLNPEKAKARRAEEERRLEESRQAERAKEEQRRQAQRAEEEQRRAEDERRRRAAMRDPCHEQITPPVTFKSESNTTRTIVLGALGATPKAGDFLGVAGPAGMAIKALGPVATIIGFFWKETDNYQAVFDAMKKYVDDVVPEMIDRARVEDLGHEVGGLRRAMDEYTRLTSPLAKGIKLSEIVTLTQTMEDKFFDFKHPEKLLTQFVTFGTLKLAARREQYLFAEEYYGPKGRDDRENVYLPELQKDVKRYSQGAAAMRDQALAWRMSKVRLEPWEDCCTNLGYQSNVPFTRYRIKDEMCGWQYDVPRIYHRQNEFNSQFKDRKLADANGHLAERADQVKQGFLNQIYPVWEIANYWEDFGKVPASGEIKSPGPVQPESTNPEQTAGPIVPCLDSKDPKARDVRTPEGKQCRRDNIDRYLAALDVAGTYNSDGLKACLSDLRKLTVAGSTGASYLTKLDECAEKAKVQNVKFSVDSATADDTSTDDSPVGDCDARCARDLIRTFMQATPEPGRAEAARATDDEPSDRGENAPASKMKDEPSEEPDDK
jgi:hypothetical protein